MNPPALTPEQLQAIAADFAGGGQVLAVTPFGSGNINDTFLVTTTRGPAEDLVERFVLQRINTQVFQAPQLVMQNMRALSEHVQACTAGADWCLPRRWEMPRVLTTAQGADSHTAQGLFWRAISFVEGADSFDTVQDLNHGREVGRGLGLFHRSIASLPPQNLADTLPGFHITPQYLAQYDLALAQTTVARSAEVNYCLEFIDRCRPMATVLEAAKAEGKLPLRTMHGDPKINNFLIDHHTGHCVSLIDLDTVKPGLIHYDIGDCLRSGCNPLGEEVEDWQAVHFEPELGRAMLEGYLETAREFLTPADYAYIYPSLGLIAFELGLRFFTDYLQGDVYFKTRYPEHNLRRALVQFRLTESIASQEATIGLIIQEMQ
jgi:Ser/Thr protein kinase RdoA (MazF antagonist)